MKWCADVGGVGNGTVAGAIKFVKTLGIEALSVGWAYVPSVREKGYLELEPVQAMKDEIEAAGVEWGPMVAWAPRDLPQGAEADEHFANLRKNFEVMAGVGTETVVMFPPGRPDTPWDEVVAYYTPLIALADEFGVRVGLHGHGRFMPSKVQWQLMNDVPSPNNGLTLCSGNIFHGDGEDMYDSTYELAKAGKVFFVHVRDVKEGEGEKEYWLDQGDVDLPRFIAALKAGGYNGYVRSEHLPTDMYRTFTPGENGVADIGTAFSVGYLRHLIK